MSRTLKRLCDRIEEPDPIFYIVQYISYSLGTALYWKYLGSFIVFSIIYLVKIMNHSLKFFFCIPAIPFQAAYGQKMEKITQTAFNTAAPEHSDFKISENNKSLYYIIKKDNLPIGYIFAEINTRDGMMEKPCAIHWINAHSGRTISIKTIGYNNYEALLCDDLHSVSIIRKNIDKAGSFDAAFLYSSDSPNTYTNGPVIFTYNASTGDFFLNEALSDKAEGSTLAEVRKSLDH